jgi:hypothetical protein
LGETIRMLRHPFRALADLTTKHVTRLVKSKRGLRGSASKREESYYEIVRQSYLEYVFGIAPLISESKALAETVARWNLEAEGIKQTRTRIVGQGSDENVSLYVNPDAEFNGAGFNVFRFTETQRTVTERRVRYICGLTSTVTAAAGSTDRLVELLGFNFRNFLPTVWEVIPWSWLADYVANVNDIIDAAVCDTSNVAWVSKTVTEVTTLTSTTTCQSARMAARLLVYGLRGGGGGSMGSLVLRRTSMTRTAGVSLGIPDLVFSLPAEGKKYANAFAAVFALRSPSAFRGRNPY